MLYELEPWCSTIYVTPEHITGYIGMEQDNTLFDLKKRVLPIDKKKKNDIIIEFDRTQLADINFGFIAQLSEILANDEGIEKDTVGEFDLGIFKIQINSTRTHEEELIKCER